MADQLQHTERNVDSAAIGRVARVARLSGLHTTGFHASLVSLIAVSEGGFGQLIRFRSKRAESELPFLVAAVDFEHTTERSGERLSLVSGEMLVVYEVLPTPEDPSRQDLDHFAEVNGIYNAWPYIRELVTSCCERLGLPRTFLPLWRPAGSIPPQGGYHELRTDHSQVPASVSATPSKKVAKRKRTAKKRNP